MENHNCESCGARAKYDAKPKSILARLWKWHTNWCPGWKKYFQSLSKDDQLELTRKYNLKA